MAIGSSGRVVVDLEPDLKQRLHSALALDGRSLKDWFVQSATEYLERRVQLRLFEPASAQVAGESEIGERLRGGPQQ